MKTAWIVILFSSFAIAQGITASGGHMTKGGNLTWGATGTSSSHLVTGYYGAPSSTGNIVSFDSGNGQFIIAIPFITPAGSPTLSTSFGVIWATSVASTHWGLELYTDTTSGCTAGYTHCPNTPVCGATSTATTSALVVSTLTASGCPATLTGNTQYWIAQYTDSNTQQEGIVGFGGYCPAPGLPAGTVDVSSSGTFAVGALWPTKFALGSADTGCHSTFVALTYTSTNLYDVVNVFPAACQIGASTCKTIFPAIGANHRLHVITESGNGVTVSSMTDSASDAFTTNNSGACPTTNNAQGTFQNCITSTSAYATTAVTSVTSTWSSASAHVAQTILDVAGEASSSSFDKAAYDTSYEASPFASPATATTTQAQELWVGAMINNQDGSSLPISAWFLPTGSWNSAYTGGYGGAGTLYGHAVFTQTVTSTGTCSATGTISVAGTNNLAGCATFK